MVESRISAAQFSGPIPPPETLAHYNEVLPGSAEKILGWAESQTRHRQDLESRVIDSDIANLKRGQIFAFTLGVAGIAVGAWLIYLGKELQGTVFGGGTLVTLALAFLYGTRQRRSDLQHRPGAPTSAP
jgi:uncharacterized membrane protein